jgi:hypothetical protein
MMVLAETSETHSFASMPNPDNVFIRDARQATIDDTSLSPEEKSRDLKFLFYKPELTTGEDSFSVIKRVIQPSRFTTKRLIQNKKIFDDSYVEYSYGASNQDQNFRNSVQNIKFTTTLGRPPAADVFPEVYVKKSELLKVPPFDFKFDPTIRKVPAYYMYSKSAPVGQCTTETSYTATRTILSEALYEAGMDLSLKNFLGSSEETMTLAWLHPSIRPGDYINSVESFSKGGKRVKSVSFTLNYNGSTEEIKNHVTCDGTQVALGIFEDLTGDITTKKEFETTAEGLKLSANVRVEENTLGEAKAFVGLRTRRAR